ncbi:hypothetical protein BDB01DRAFT_848668 [Pilobolus umbonatus]|nr:hypothetical protein BDB01DRAFT_848668 [Pilobolus umbonatus]
MPCLGARKRAVLRTPSSSTNDTPSSSNKSIFSSAGLNERNSLDNTLNERQMDIQLWKQKYNELKIKNTEYSSIIMKQTEEIDKLNSMIKQLNTQISDTKKTDFTEEEYQENLLLIAEKDELIREKTEIINSLKKTIHILQHTENTDDNHKRKREHVNRNDDDTSHPILSELEKMKGQLEDKDNELKELKKQWIIEKAELVKPALQQVSSQLEELKMTNKIVVERLADKESELAELKSKLTVEKSYLRVNSRRSTSEQENRKRMNRLTLDLENDRLLIQKLDDLNNQLEMHKQTHEDILKEHAKIIQEKDEELIQHEKSLLNLKRSHEYAVRDLKNKHEEHMEKLKIEQNKHLDILNKKMKSIEQKTKSNIDDEVNKILTEFEQSEHNHMIEVANLQQSYKNQVSVMKKGQQAELQHLLGNIHDDETKATAPQLRKTGGPNNKVRWPVISHEILPDLRPQNPHEIHVYVSSVSKNNNIKRNQDTLLQIFEINDIKYKVIDVAKSELALQHMRKHSITRSLPQIFIGGFFRFQYEECIDLIESGQWKSKFNTPSVLNTEYKQQRMNLDESYLPSPMCTPPTIYAKRNSFLMKTPEELEDVQLLNELQLELENTRKD